MTLQVAQRPFIRPYRPEDQPRLLEIWHAASALGHPFLGAERLEAQKRLVGEVYLPQAETFVAARGAVLLGFVGLLDAFIGGLFVDPSCYGQGIGAALVRHAQALKGGLSLNVYEANAGARAFYARLGFVETGRQDKDDEGLPFPVIRMTSARQ
ncbi:GNAT family N-acetyltransferase [Xanthobacter sp. TB0139]|uniref:GNAT family N-acetyltransferase n=1 Tax=Xanthobacter sp. TB0139 TaxID=3459178 RepID=UPI00403A0ECC